MRLQGKTALITGASRNLGKATALAFAREGADVLVNTRTNQDELDAVADACRELGVRVLPILADVSQAEQVFRMVDQGLEHFGKIDVLVSNAAIRPHTAITDLSVEEWHQVMGVNLHATFYLCKAVTPSMMQHRSGSIITFGGMASVSGRPNTVAVTAAKTGVLGLTRSLAAELGPYGVRVNMVVPGSMATERRYPEWYPEYQEVAVNDPERMKSIPLRRQGTPEELASTCVFLASDESSYITGDRILCMGGRFIG
jgi:NAD(P)-dependent dehydrogenase (short-subunit alcohol dehydrogenase family)